MSRNHRFTDNSGEDVSPDFYAWVFPKCDHVAVGTGTVVDKKLDQKAKKMRVLLCFTGLLTIGGC
jgi:flavin-dependent dehydrogenase